VPKHPLCGFDARPPYERSLRHSELRLTAHSMTLSAPPRSDWGIVTFSASAVLRFTTSAKLQNRYVGRFCAHQDLPSVRTSARRKRRSFLRLSPPLRRARKKGIPRVPVTGAALTSVTSVTCLHRSAPQAGRPHGQLRRARVHPGAAVVWAVLQYLGSSLASALTV
jgi:hypothetical protein